MNELAFASIGRLQELLAKKEISKPELLDYFLKRLAKFDPELGSLLETFDAESILADVANDGVLAAIPGVVKDNICQNKRIASCASKIIEHYRAPYDATAVARLKKEGAYILGRANMDEFAMGSSNETSAFFKTRNPWDHSRVPGGSSGGSIAAVAAGLSAWSLGSETGGSVRQPAALCGIVGLKPTYGLISRSGLVAYASSLDQIGIATRSVRDNALVLSTIAGQDSSDLSSLPVSQKDYTQLLDGKIKPGLTIGILDDMLHAKGVDDEVVESIEQSIKVFENLGAKIKRITMPILDYSAAVYFILSRAEAASNLSRFDGVRYGMRDCADNLQEMYSKTRHDGFGREVKARIMTGNYVLSVGHAGDFYLNAKKTQRLMRHKFAEVFKDVDVLLAPTSPAPAFKFGAFDENKLQLDLQDYFTCAMNIAGIPAISVPCGFAKNNMPLGMQLIGPRLSEDYLYQTAHAYEQQTQWHTMHPKEYV